jgi:hypothetical protein
MLLVCKCAVGVWCAKVMSVCTCAVGEHFEHVLLVCSMRMCCWCAHLLLVCCMQFLHFNTFNCDERLNCVLDPRTFAVDTLADGTLVPKHVAGGT